MVRKDPGVYPAPAVADRKTRIHYLDTLKVAVVYGIFVYHAALPFTWTSWLVSNRQKSLVLTALAMFCFPWGIPMMFLLAGADSWFALRSRAPGAFLRSRFLRLVLPLAAGIALLSPLTAYLAGSGNSRSVEALVRAYPAFFRRWSSTSRRRSASIASWFWEVGGMVVAPGHQAPVVQRVAVIEQPTRRLGAGCAASGLAWLAHGDQVSPDLQLGKPGSRPPSAPSPMRPANA